MVSERRGGGVMSGQAVCTIVAGNYLAHARVLDASLRRRLRQGPGSPERTDFIGDGSRVIREWRGVMYEVERVPEGYLWNGKVHASLSAVAYAITGAKWNGPRFFGLRDGWRCRLRQLSGATGPCRIHGRPDAGSALPLFLRLE